MIAAPLTLASECSAPSAVGCLFATAALVADDLFCAGRWTMRVSSFDADIDEVAWALEANCAAAATDEGEAIIVIAEEPFGRPGPKSRSTLAKEPGEKAALAVVCWPAPTPTGRRARVGLAAGAAAAEEADGAAAEAAAEAAAVLAAAADSVRALSLSAWSCARFAT